MQHKENYHKFQELTTEKFNKVKDLLQKLHKDSITEKELLSQISKEDIANYRLMCQNSNYTL